MKKKKCPHWTDRIEISENKELEFAFKGARFQTTAFLAVVLGTFACLIGLAYIQAPWFSYVIAPVTGIAFGLLVKQKNGQKRKS